MFAEVVGKSLQTRNSLSVPSARCSLNSSPRPPVVPFRRKSLNPESPPLSGRKPADVSFALPMTPNKTSTSINSAPNQNRKSFTFQSLEALNSVNCIDLAKLDPKMDEESNSPGRNYLINSTNCSPTRSSTISPARSATRSPQRKRASITPMEPRILFFYILFNSAKSPEEFMRQNHSRTMETLDMLQYFVLADKQSALHTRNELARSRAESRTNSPIQSRQHSPLRSSVVNIISPFEKNGSPLLLNATDVSPLNGSISSARTNVVSPVHDLESSNILTSLNPAFVRSVNETDDFMALTLGAFHNGDTLPTGFTPPAGEQREYVLPDQSAFMKLINDYKDTGVSPVIVCNK